MILTHWLRLVRAGLHSVANSHTTARTQARSYPLGSSGGLQPALAAALDRSHPVRRVPARHHWRPRHHLA